MVEGKGKAFHLVARKMGWTRSSYYLVSGFLLTVFLIAYIWWPLAEEALAYFDWSGPWWLHFDWLLVGIFLVMSLLIMAYADLKVDAWIIFVGFVGGLVIESWGTQTEIWWYYTSERPPLWIIPAWPIASISIDRIVLIFRRRFLQKTTAESHNNHDCQHEFIDSQSSIVKLMYWIIFLGFFGLMVNFIYPTLDKSLTIMAVFLVAFLILTPTDHRLALLTFIAGSGLGYFLEYWGTTRECWTYYTIQKPPVFAVLAHGMAAVAFWRTNMVLRIFSKRILFSKKRGARSQTQPKHP